MSDIVTVESSLKDSLKRIFGLKKVTTDAPSESREQDVLFVELESSRVAVKEKKIVARVKGIARIFSTSDKLPIGYFAKRIAEALKDDTAPFYFHDIDESSNNYANLVERSFAFVYLISLQYDPDITDIEDLTLSEV